MSHEKGKQATRRGFIKSTGAAAAGFMVMRASTALGAQANERLRLGVIGCGGRGGWIGDLFQQNTNTKVVAVHDYFKDRVEMAGKRLDVDEAHQFIGLDGYKELIASDIDAVAVESPPYFHPEQAVAAIEAGKHVYLAKPIAVDVPGCKAIVDAAARVGGKQSVLVDFQTRNDPLYREAARMVRDGIIGDPVCGQSYYYCGRLGLKEKPGSEVARLRNWVFDIPLSGDIIVEQNIHVIDVANWLLQGHPVKAEGTGGRKARTDVGDCWDHFAVTYTYPNDVIIDFSSGQFTYGYDDLCTRIFGSLGTIDTHYGGEVYIKHKSGKWEGGVTSKIYKEGAVNNMKDFHAAIMAGSHLNNTRESADSTMASILGRTAAYRGEPVTWDQMIQENEKLDPHLDLPKDGPLVKRGQA